MISKYLWLLPEVCKCPVHHVENRPIGDFRLPIETEYINLGLWFSYMNWVTYKPHRDSPCLDWLWVAMGWRAARGRVVSLLIGLDWPVWAVACRGLRILWWAGEPHCTPFLQGLSYCLVGRCNQVGDVLTLAGVAVLSAIPAVTQQLFFFWGRWWVRVAAYAFGTALPKFETGNWQ